MTPSPRPWDFFQTKWSKSVLKELDTIEALQDGTRKPSKYLRKAAYIAFSTAGSHLTTGLRMPRVKELEAPGFLDTIHKQLTLFPNVKVPRVSVLCESIQIGLEHLKSLQDVTPVLWRPGLNPTDYNLDDVIKDFWLEFGYRGRPELSINPDSPSQSWGQKPLPWPSFLQEVKNFYDNPIYDQVPLRSPVPLVK